MALSTSSSTVALSLWRPSSLTSTKPGLHCSQIGAAWRGREILFPRSIGPDKQITAGLAPSGCGPRLPGISSEGKIGEAGYGAGGHESAGLVTPARSAAKPL